MSKAEILIEIRKFGQQCRVVGIDTHSGVEVVMIMPTNTPRTLIERQLRAKLERRLTTIKAIQAGSYPKLKE
jgi:hypothetical protein